MNKPAFVSHRDLIGAADNLDKSVGVISSLERKLRNAATRSRIDVQIMKLDIITIKNTARFARNHVAIIAHHNDAIIPVSVYYINSLMDALLKAKHWINVCTHLYAASGVSVTDLDDLIACIQLSINALQGNNEL